MINSSIFATKKWIRPTGWSIEGEVYTEGRQASIGKGGKGKRASLKEKGKNLGRLSSRQVFSGGPGKPWFHFMFTQTLIEKGGSREKDRKI